MNFSPMLKNYNVVASVVPEFRYDGKLEFSVWQKAAREKLKSLLGMDKLEPCEPMFNIEYKKENDEFTEYRFTIQSEKNYFFPAVVRVPIGMESGKHPVMICLQGHSNGMHISLGEPKYPGDEDCINSGDRDFCVRAVKEGYIAVAMEQRNFGECNGMDEPGINCYQSSMRALLCGRTTIGERVWDVSRCIDALLANFTNIDPERICLMGNSGGGTATYYAACIDERICLAMPSCAVCSFDNSIAYIRHCSCNFIPNIANYFDMGDLGGLIAPRKLVVVHGMLDRDFKADGVFKSFDLIKNAYETAGVPDNCILVSGQEGHRFYADIAWPNVHKLMK